MFWKQRISNLTARVHQSTLEIQNAQALGNALFHHGLSNANQYPQHFSDRLAQNSQELHTLLANLEWPAIAPWDHPSWQSWQLSSSPLSLVNAALIRAGESLEQRSFNGSQPFSAPHFVPFLGQNQTLILRCDNATRDQGLSLLQSLVMRTILLLPDQIRYTFFDPTDHGEAFLIRHALPEAWIREQSGDLYHDLLAIAQDIHTIQETYLNSQVPALHILPTEIRMNEPFEGIFVADFPKGFDRREIEALTKIGASGPPSGKYLLIHYNSDIPLPDDIELNDFNNSYILDLQALAKPQTNCQIIFKPDSAPAPELQQALLNVIKQATPPERTRNWDEIVGPSHSIWSDTSIDLIKTPIGARGSADSLNLWFGTDSEGRQCTHGLLRAMTGSEKSMLYHVLLLGFAIRYSPNELRLYLINGKEGVELAPYRNLPHTEVVALHSSPELSRSILTELVEETERRNALFKQAEVNDFRSYRALAPEKTSLHRILLVIDEYQELFSGDQDGIASHQLLMLAQQGHSTGIHLLLASQSLDAAEILHQTEILSHIHLRMGMKMANAHIQALTELGQRGQQLLMNCDLPSQLVVNDDSGDDRANSVGEVACLQPEHRDQLIQWLNEQALNRPDIRQAEMILCNENAQPNLVHNPQLRYLLSQRRWLTASEWEILAHQPHSQQGLAVADWFAAESPAALWLGQEFSVHKHATMILRRRTGEQTLVIGGKDHPTRYGMLVAMLISLALGVNPQKAQFRVLDRSIPGTQWHKTVELVSYFLLNAAGFRVTFQREVNALATLLDQLTTILTHRQQMSELELMQQPSIFVMLTELDRVDEIHRSIDSHEGEDSSLGEQLKTLYQNGASKGIHLILSFASLNAMAKVIDLERGLPNFRHRIALQMSEEDSLTYLGHPQAARLQSDGAIPIRALYSDMESDRTLLFKPYSTESTPSFSEQLDFLGQHLGHWGIKRDTI
jgi:DNA segregation ATPase FtsK/SpoIIIE, S-DNA-T family